MVACVQPKPLKTISDPACGTGGFFLAAYDWIVENHSLDREEKEFIKNKTFYGNEIVANTRRMCLMNMYLHNIGEIDGESFISPNDALVSDDGTRYDYVLANPPFGKKSTMTSTNEQGDVEKEDLSYNRQDFWETTSNKQLNFLQHIKTQLKINGEAAVVLPDNVLFEGGAGEEVRKQLLKTTNLHTILRLPTGIFYAQGVKANVLFFTNKPASKEAWTKEIWFYDYRTNVHHTPKKSPMREEHLKEFVELYNGKNIDKREETWSEDNQNGRWKKYTYDEVIARDKTSLDIFWLRDKSLTDLENLPDPDILANEIMENLESGLNSFRGIVEAIGSDED
jgi:type I restriction enzyme M protein